MITYYSTLVRYEFPRVGQNRKIVKPRVFFGFEGDHKYLKRNLVHGGFEIKSTRGTNTPVGCSQ